MISTSCLRISVALGYQFEQLSQHFLAVLPVERKSKLGIEQTKLDADVVAAARNLQSQIAFLLRQLDQRRGKGRVERNSTCPVRFRQNFHYGWRKYVH